jgi:predicted DNA-binding protein YlxM (UPF0122 family)
MKLNAEEVDHVCSLYYLSDMKMIDIARLFKVSAGTVGKAINEHGLKFSQEHEKEIFQFKQKK